MTLQHMLDSISESERARIVELVRHPPILPEPDEPLTAGMTRDEIEVFRDAFRLG